MGFEISGQKRVHKNVKFQMKLENIEIMDMLNFVMQRGWCVVKQTSGEGNLKTFCEKNVSVRDDDDKE